MAPSQTEREDLAEFGKRADTRGIRTAGTHSMRASARALLLPCALTLLPAACEAYTQGQINAELVTSDAPEVVIEMSRITEQSAEGGAEMMYELNEAAKAAQELESTQGRV